MGRGSPECGEIEPVRELFQADERLDRLRRADPREHVEQRHRLDTLGAKVLGAVRAEPLRELALGRDQQRLVREPRRLGPERLEHLDLRRAVRDMVLAPDNVRDA